jgi:peptidoglycan biosynthesis protein MviN/MurJ (putative lipid II flippase)
VSIFTALLPPMSGRWADPRHRRAPHAVLARGARHDRRHRPAAFGYLALAIPIVSLLLQHGRADATDAENIAPTCRRSPWGCPFFSAFQLLTRTFYAMQDTRTPRS